jgi:hypothetical protein
LNGHYSTVSAYPASEARTVLLRSATCVIVAL